MAVRPAKEKNTVLAAGSGYEVQAENAKGSSVIEIVFQHQPETDRAAALSALQAARSDLGGVNFGLNTRRHLGGELFLHQLAPVAWQSVLQDVKLVPDRPDQVIDTGALQATAGLTLAALRRFLGGDSTIASGLENMWQDSLTAEIRNKLFDKQSAMIGSAVQVHPELWPKTVATVRQWALDVARRKGVESLPEEQLNELTTVAVSLVRVPLISYTRQGAPNYDKLLAGNLLHKTTLARCGPRYSPNRSATSSHRTPPPSSKHSAQSRRIYPSAN